MAEQIQLVEAPVFLPVGVPIPKRPTDADPFVQRRTVELIYPDVEKYLKSCNSDVSDRAGIEKDILKVLKACRYGDGYELAKGLERWCYWAADSELVEVMENVFWAQSGAVKELTKQWVKVYGITIPFEVGDKVKPIGRHYKTGTVMTVYDLRPDTAEVGVQDAHQESTTSCYIYGYESLESVSSTT